MVPVVRPVRARPLVSAAVVASRSQQRSKEAGTAVAQPKNVAAAAAARDSKSRLNQK